MPESKVKRRRLHITGITPAIVESDLLARLQKFGRISKVDGLGASDANGQVRRFAFVTLSSTKPELDNCLVAFKNVKWKGSIVSVARAKKGAFEKESKKDRKKAKVVQERVEAVDRKRKRSELRSETEGYQAKDVDVPITDGNIEGKREWKKAKYGRAVRVMKLTKDDGKKFTFDPSANKESLQKLYGKAIGERVEATTKMAGKAENLSVSVNPPAIVSPPPTPLKPSKRIKETSEITTIAELEKSIQEEKSRNASILQAMFDTTAIINQGEEGESVEVNQEKESDGQASQGEESDGQASQEEYSDGDINQEEEIGEAVQDEEVESVSDADQEEGEEDHDEDAPKVTNSKTNAVNGVATADTEMSDKDSSNTSSDSESVASPEDSSMKTDPSNNVQMKSLTNMFTPGVESERFSLFADADSDKEEESEQEIPQHMRLEPIKQRDTNAMASLRSVDQTRLRGFETKLPLFFFHMDKPSLRSRSSYDKEAKFGRSMTMEEVVADWESRRLELTRDFKAKAKEARKYSRRRRARR